LAVNINISNYEEFLLSAIDGELTGEERAALEAFMDLHPEIRKELALLESTKLQPDTSMQFDAKDMLYRKSDVLSATNYERFLLDYVDNELSTAERTQLEALIGQHPHIQQELRLLQSARLTPDLAVTFENKASLYRKEQTRIRPLWWWSAAAAVVAGLSFWLIPGQRTGEPAAVAVNQPAAQTSTSSQTAPQTGTVPQVSSSSVAQNDNPASTQPQVADNVTNDQVQHPTTAADKNRNTTLSNALAHNRVADKAVNRPAPEANESNQQEPANHIPDTRAVALAKIPQPASTSGEVVQQLQEKSEQQEKILAENATVVAEKSATMANATKISSAAPEAASAAPANVKGELVVAVTMNGDSKLLNGVANVARFLSRKKK
jgi:anti-sigma factor RsiW